MDFKERFNHALMLRNKTAQDVSNATNISKSSISRYLSGGRKPKIEQVRKIAKYLEVNTLYLLGEADNMTAITYNVHNSIELLIGEDLSQELVEREALMQEIDAVCSQNDVDTLKVIRNIIMTFKKMD